jgi:hypothetical protein
MENDRRKRSMKPSLMRIALTCFLVPVVLLLSVAAFAGEINKAVKGAEKEPAPIAGAKVKAAEDKKPIEPAAAPAQITPAKIGPAERQIEPLSTYSDDSKGRVIKWQIICTGSGCGNDNVLFLSPYQDFHILCGTLGQVAVGRGSSPSFGINQGFWQETITGEYLRGDANQDGIINVGDIVYLVSYLYKNGPAPAPVWVGDCNCDEIVNVGDIVFLVSYLYKGGPEPSC